MAGPCGVPELSWPYACAVDENNGMHFDSATGKLWAHPHVPPVYYESAAAFLPLSGVKNFANTGDDVWFRVWLAAAWAEYGAIAAYDVTSLVTVSHTNNTCVPQVARGYVRVPEVRWFSTYQTVRALMGVRGYINGSLIMGSNQGVHDGNGISYTDPGLAGYPWSAGYPNVIGIPSEVGLPAQPAGLQNVRFPSYNVDVFEGWHVVAPGATIQFAYRVRGITPDTINPSLVVGSLPDRPYLSSYVDVLDEGRLIVEVLPAA